MLVGAGFEPIAFPETSDPTFVGNGGLGEILDLDISDTIVFFMFPLDETVFPTNQATFGTANFNGVRISDIGDQLRDIVSISASNTGFLTIFPDAGDITIAGDGKSFFVHWGSETRLDDATLTLAITFANADPVISAPASVNVPENSTAVADVDATDADS